MVRAYSPRRPFRSLIRSKHAACKWLPSAPLYGPYSFRPAGEGGQHCAPLRPPTQLLTYSHPPHPPRHALVHTSAAASLQTSTIPLSQCSTSVFRSPSQSRAPLPRPFSPPLFSFLSLFTSQIRPLTVGRHAARSTGTLLLASGAPAAIAASAAAECALRSRNGPSSHRFGQYEPLG